VHCHVRDPETGVPSRDLDLYREVTDRIRDADVDVVLNLTAGMGGDITFGSTDAPLPVNEAGTDMIGAAERVAHVAECLPEICTLDCGTMNFAEADYVMTNTPGMLRAMGRMMTDLGVKARDRGLRHRPSVVRQGTGEGGHPRSARAGAAVHGRAMGGAGRPEHLHGDGEQRAGGLDLFRVFAGSEPDGLCRRGRACRGACARRARGQPLARERACSPRTRSLVERAVGVVEGMGARVIGPAEVREKLGLTKRAPVAA
jgi:hypothetical protein